MDKYETGTVIQAKGDDYLVEPDIQEGCMSCKHRRGCHGSSGDQKRCFICSSPIQLNPGDRVAFILVFPLIYASVLLYLLPALLVIMGAVLGSRLIKIFSDSDLNTFMGVIMAFLVSALLIFVLKRRSVVARIVKQI